MGQMFRTATSWAQLLDSAPKRDIIRGPASCDSAWHDSACTVATHCVSQEKKRNERCYFALRFRERIAGMRTSYLCAGIVETSHQFLRHDQASPHRGAANLAGWKVGGVHRVHTRHGRKPRREQHLGRADSGGSRDAIDAKRTRLLAGMVTGRKDAGISLFA